MFTTMNNMGFNQMGNNNAGPRPTFFDRRNRHPHEIFKKFGGILGPQDVTGILQIDWKKLNLPKFKKNFYKVIFKFFVTKHLN